MAQLIFLLVVFTSLFPLLVLGHTRQSRMSQILKPGQRYCDLKCGDNPHTLCNPDTRKIAFDCGKDFYEYDVAKELELKIDFMMGHNGIRNRIAKRMQAADMRELLWDKELAAMASIWIRKCKPYEKDPCTTVRVHTENSTDGLPIINQSGAYVRSEFFPPDFVASVLRNWYLEKNTMNPPHLSKKAGKVFGTFDVENNFTQLAWAATFRIGCAVARYQGGYQIICNYLPYGRSGEDAFQSGKPVSYCPNLAPLTDILFENLCSTDDRACTIHANWFLISLLTLIHSTMLNKYF